MKFDYAILTAPRPQSTLTRTLYSLHAGGFLGGFVFDGSPPEGESPSPKWCTAAYIALFQHWAQSNSSSDGLLVFEDDVVVCRGLAELLDKSAWPESIEQIAAVSPYCHTAYSNYGMFGRWHREDKRTTLAGTQAFLYPRAAVKKLMDHLVPEDQAGVDVQLGQFAQKYDLHIWYHLPSLVQHIGRFGNSAVGLSDCGTIYYAETFVGENFDARTIV
jgi:hypothetical protein